MQGKEEQEVIDTGDLDTRLPAFVHDPSYRKNIRRGLELQQQIETLSALSSSMRAEAGSMENISEKYQLQKKIILLEDSIIRLNSLADSIFRLVSATEENSVPEDRPVLMLYDIIDGIRIYAYDLKQIAVYDTGGYPAGSSTENEDQERQTTGAGQFRIFAVSPYTEEMLPDSLYEIPDGTFYWIQLAALSKPVNPGHFGGIWPVTSFRVPDTGLVKYYAGRFSRYEDARAALGQVREYGFPDAYIIGYYNRQMISVTKAQQYEIREVKKN
jgi:hypothetical protein